MDPEHRGRPSRQVQVARVPLQDGIEQLLDRNHLLPVLGHHVNTHAFSLHQPPGIAGKRRSPGTLP